MNWQVVSDGVIHASAVNWQALSFSFMSGVLMLFNPCGFAMLPAYVSLFLQHNLQTGGSITKKLIRAVFLSLLTSLGFIIVFSIIGLAAGGLSDILSKLLNQITVFIALLILVLGILIISGKDALTSISLDRFDPTKKVQVKNTSYLFFFLYGIGYALTSIGCAFPIFLTVLTSSMGTTNFLEPLKNLLVLSLGMSLTLLAISILIALLGNVMITFLRKYLGVVKKIMGLVVTGAGVYLIYKVFYQKLETEIMNPTGLESLVSFIAAGIIYLIVLETVKLFIKDKNSQGM